MVAELLIAASLLLDDRTRSAPPRQVYERPALRTIDGGRQDRNPLETSFYVPSFDMSGAPIGFQRAYRVEGIEDRVVRANGGLYAISPYATYAKTKRGEAPTVAPSTVFAIGMPLDWCVRRAQVQAENEARIDQRVAVRAEGRADGRVAQQASEAVPTSGRGRIAAAPSTRAADMPPIVTDESYRRRFYRSLIRDSL